jgi:hypothetical protein
MVFITSSCTTALADDNHFVSLNLDPLRNAAYDKLMTS